MLREPDRISDNGSAGAPEQGSAVVPFPGSRKPCAHELQSLSDDQLMLLARGGVSRAFDVIVRRHQAKVLAFTAKRLGSVTAAQDATQSTFLGVYRYTSKYRPCDKFVAFLFRIALNECRMSKRRAARAARALQLLKTEPPPTQKLANEQVLTKERLRESQIALRKLASKQRDVVLLRFGAGLSYQEIAQTLHIPVGTVKSRLFNGLAKLHTQLEGHQI